MKQWKQKAALALTLLMAGSAALTACGGQSSDGQSSSGQSSSETTSDAQTSGGQTSDSTGTAADATADFTWLAHANDASNYNIEIEDHPVVKLWLQDPFTVDGQQVDVNIDFSVPADMSDMTSFVNTLMSSGDYMDVMDTMTLSSFSLPQLYADGTIMDLTDLIPKYMPNYNAWLEANPEIASQLAMKTQDGKKYLAIYQVVDEPQNPWCGFMYRRDWLVNYGTNPETGEAFTGGWNEDKTEWTDDVVFPSGNTDPVYLSDWEWMMPIFEEAEKDLGIEDGYIMQMYYPGAYYYGNVGDDLVSGFQGYCGYYLDEDGVCRYGATEDNFRTYLQVMNDWYEKGWIDPSFDERTEDAMWFMIDNPTVYGGKVGLWYGMNNCTANQLDMGTSDYTVDICVYGCATPINDLYGDASAQGKEPRMNYGMSAGLVDKGVVLTNKAEEKNYPALLTAIDACYTLEGGRLMWRGLSKEQQAEMQDEFYNENGLEDGAYWMENRDGVDVLVINPATKVQGDLENGCRMQRLLGLFPNANTDNGYPSVHQLAVDQWKKYTDSGAIKSYITAQLSAEDAQEASTNNALINTYTAQAWPDFITGRQDINDDAAWEAYVNGLNDIGVDGYCEKINAILE